MKKNLRFFTPLVFFFFSYIPYYCWVAIAQWLSQKLFLIMYVRSYMENSTDYIKREHTHQFLKDFVAFQVGLKFIQTGFCAFLLFSYLTFNHLEAKKRSITTLDIFQKIYIHILNEQSPGWWSVKADCLFWMWGRLVQIWQF